MRCTSCGDDGAVLEAGEQLCDECYNAPACDDCGRKHGDCSEGWVSPDEPIVLCPDCVVAREHEELLARMAPPTPEMMAEYEAECAAFAAAEEAEARFEAEEKARYEIELEEAKRLYPHACKTCYGEGLIHYPGSYEIQDETEPCDCLAAGRCPRCAGEADLVEADYYDYSTCKSCGYDERSAEPVLPFHPFF